MKRTFCIFSLIFFLNSFCMEENRENYIKILSSNAEIAIRKHDKGDANSREKTINFITQLASEETLNHCIDEHTLIVHIQEQEEKFLQASKELVTVFCARVQDYLKHMKKNDFISPTTEQYNNYIENKKIKEDIKKTIEAAAIVGIFRDKEKLLSIALHPIGNELAIIEFENLLKHMDDIKKIPSSDLKNLARFLIIEAKHELKKT